MTREEAEARIAELVRQIDEVHKQYNPDAGILSMGIKHSDGEGSIFFFNSHWDRDAEHPLDYFEMLGGDKDD